MRSKSVLLVLIVAAEAASSLCAGTQTGRLTQKPESGGIVSPQIEKTLKRIRPITPTTKTCEFAEVEIALDDRFSLDDASALPRAPGSDLELLSAPTRARLQLPANNVKVLRHNGVNLTVLRKFVLVESLASDGQGTLNSDFAAQSSGEYVQGSNDTDIGIPDEDGWVYSDIPIATAPTAATVTSVDVHYEIIHSYVADLQVDVTDQDLTYEYRLWDNEGGSATYINETETGITTFNGETVNQTWLLWARDTLFLFTGYIDYWWIKVYYEGEDYDDYIQADSYSENTVEVIFAFSSNPGTVCFSRSPACGSLDPICDDPVLDNGYYFVSTKYNPCEDECSSVTITADPTSGSNQTRTVHLDDRFHIGYHLQSELGASTYDTDTGEPASAAVTVTVIPANAGTAVPPSGTSQYNPVSGLYEFWSTYTAGSYAGRVRVKFTVNNTPPHDDSIIIYSFDQNNDSLAPASDWQTLCDTFCTEGWYLNYYQIYKIYLLADTNYDFSLCDNDGVGASCDGDGDLEMLNSSGTSLWYIDGQSSCGYDASTLGTAYEGWSPPSDGYYYLMVSEFSGNPTSYCLAYRGQSDNHDPQLSNGDVNPDSGDTDTAFYWYVDYYDQDGDSPSTKYVHTNSANYVMQLYSGSASDGTYRFGPLMLPVGTHSYYFYFEDGQGGTARLPAAGSSAGPTVSPVKHTLTVASSNPDSGVSITVSPADSNGYSNGVTQFVRVYDHNTTVMLTAPPTADANSFKQWQRNGSYWVNTLDSNITMDADYTLTAVYEEILLSPLTVDLNKDGIPNFQDFSNFASSWRCDSCPPPMWCDGRDFDHDSLIDGYDLRILSEFWLWPVADIDMDSKVNFIDYALLCELWEQTECRYPDWCNGRDLDKSCVVDISDLALWTEYWLAGH